MPRHNRWPTEAELQRIEAIATFARIAEMADSTFDAIERGDIAGAVAHLGRLKGKAARGRYLLKNLPPMEVYDGVME